MTGPSEAVEVGNAVLSLAGGTDVGRAYAATPLGGTDAGPAYAATPLCGTDKQMGQTNVVRLWPGLGWANRKGRVCMGRGMYLQTSVAQ